MVWSCIGFDFHQAQREVSTVVTLIRNHSSSAVTRSKSWMPNEQARIAMSAGAKIDHEAPRERRFVAV
jgi:hypothetical protein